MNDLLEKLMDAIDALEQYNSNERAAAARQALRDVGLEVERVKKTMREIRARFEEVNL
jgi:uncharacterized protein with GYD domain